jgi:hypothetical protein
MHEQVPCYLISNSLLFSMLQNERKAGNLRDYCGLRRKRR